MDQSEDVFSTLIQIQKLSQSASEQVRLLKAKCTTLEAEKSSLRKHVDILRAENDLNLQRIAEKDEALETISESVKKAVTEFVDLKTRFDKTVADNERLASELALTNNRFKLYEALIPAHASLTSLCPPMFLSHESNDPEKSPKLVETSNSPPASAPPRMFPPYIGKSNESTFTAGYNPSTLSHTPRSPAGNTIPSNGQHRRNTVGAENIRLASPKELNLLFHKLETELASIQTRSSSEKGKFSS